MGDQIRMRYPRLVRAMVRGCGVSDGEAVEALVEYQVFGMTEEPSTAGVARAGGQLAAIRCGIRCRHTCAAGKSGALIDTFA